MNIKSVILKIQIKKPKYSFSRAKWWYSDIFPNEKVYTWCIEQFGPPLYDSWSRWCCEFNTFRFRDERDYTLFLLKWQ